MRIRRRVVGDDEAVRQRLDAPSCSVGARRRHRAGVRPRAARGARGRSGVLLAEQRSPTSATAVLPSARRTRTSSTRPVTRTAASSDWIGCALSASKRSAKARPMSALGRQAEQLDWRRDWPPTTCSAASVDDQHRPRRRAGTAGGSASRRADARIFALHRLLGIGEALLQRGDGAQVAADGDDAAVAADAAWRSSGREGRRRGRGMVDLPPARRRLRRRPRPAAPRSCRGSRR